MRKRKIIRGSFYTNGVNPTGCILTDLDNDWRISFSKNNFSWRISPIGTTYASTYPAAIDVFYIDYPQSPEPGTIMTGQTIYLGETPSFLVTDSASDTGVTYQWKYSPLEDYLPNFRTIFGANNETYQPGTLLYSTWFSRLAVDSNFYSNYSNTVKITVLDSEDVEQINSGLILDPGVIGDPQTILQFETPATLTNIISGSDILIDTEHYYTLGVVTYQWEYASSALTFVDIPDATSLDLAGPYLFSLATSTWFRRRVNRKIYYMNQHSWFYTAVAYTETIKIKVVDGEGEEILVYDPGPPF